MDDLEKFKRSCRLKTKKAIKKGEIKIKNNCETCGSTERVECHHVDYNDHLNVVFLCKKCHVNEHVRLNKEKEDQKFEEHSRKLEEIYGIVIESLPRLSEDHIRFLQQELYQPITIYPFMFRRKNEANE